MKNQKKKRTRLHRLYVCVVLLLCICHPAVTAEAKSTFAVSGQCEESPKAAIRIRVDAGRFDGFDIYRMDQSGIYQYVDYIGIGKTETATGGQTEEDDDYDYDGGYDYSKDIYDAEWKLEKKKYVEYRTYYFKDQTPLTVSQTYRYKVVGYRFVNDVKTEIESAETSVTILSAGPAGAVGKRSGKLGVKLSWDMVPDADGYEIYCMTDYDSKSNYIEADINDLSAYTLAKTIDNPNTTSTSFSGRMNGVTYTYRVCAYKNEKGKRTTSTYSAPASVLMDYYSYASETGVQKVKRAFGSEKKRSKNYKSAAKAAKQMKTIKIKVWDFKKGKKGKKVTKTKYLTVNKKLAPSITQMFNEIYKSKEKQVIKDIGCYSYRQGQHMYGLAIDINPNENYMIDGKKVMAGSYWKPKKDPYSIPLDCEMVRIMERYGFTRGFWGERKDYMHFSYEGV